MTMVARAPGVLGLCLLLGCAPRERDHADEAELTGSVSYIFRAGDRHHEFSVRREWMALPADSEIKVTLSDISRQGVAAWAIAETTIAPAGRQVPIPFVLRFDPAQIDSQHTYAVRATIRSGGRLIFTTDTVHQVLTRGHPRHIDLWLAYVPGDLASAAQPEERPFWSRPMVAGKLVLRAGELWFIPCGTKGEGIHVTESPYGGWGGMAAIKDLGGGEDGITVLLRLEENRIQEVRYAGLEGPGCEQLPPEGTIEARGDEPFWQMQVTGTEAVLRTPEELDGVHYRNGRWTRPSDAQIWRFEAGRELPESVEMVMLEITVTRTPCRDSMSGARYPMRAVLTRGIQRWEGCALEGRQSYAPWMASP